MLRWQEERLILEEEMRRIVAFFEGKAKWWVDQAYRRQLSNTAMLSGVLAYAYKQAHICSQMADSYGQYWVNMFEKHGFLPLWGKKYVGKGANKSMPNRDGDETDSEAESGPEDIDNPAHRTAELDLDEIFRLDVD